MTDEMTMANDPPDGNRRGGTEPEVPAAPPTVTMSHGADLESMSASGRRLHARRFDLVALILAVPALWVPGWWLWSALVLYFVLLVYRHVAKMERGAAWGPATFVSVPFQVLVGMVYALPRILLAAVGAVFAMVAGFVAVGIVTGLIGMLAGFVLHHDTGDLLLANFKATSIAWGSQFGVFGAAYLITRQAIRQATDSSEGTGNMADAEHGLVRTVIDQIGEVGLMAMVGFSAIAVIFFSLFAPIVWRPFGGYRGVTGFVHLRTPVESALDSLIMSGTGSALNPCSATFKYFDSAEFGPHSTTLKILFQPAAGTSSSADAALIAARITNRVTPVVDFTIITSAGANAISETLASSQYRTTVFRSVQAAGAVLEPPVPTSASLTSLDPLLKNCSA